MLSISAIAQLRAPAALSSSRTSIGCPVAGNSVTTPSAWSQAGHALVDEGEHEDAADVAGVVEVDEQVLAAGARAAPVVGVELDVRRPVQRAERVAERLHDALAAVGELVEAAEVEVDRAAAAAAHQLLEEATAAGTGGRAFQLRLTRSRPPARPLLRQRHRRAPTWSASACSARRPALLSRVLEVIVDPSVAGATVRLLRGRRFPYDEPSRASSGDRPATALSRR